MSNKTSFINNNLLKARRIHSADFPQMTKSGQYTRKLGENILKWQKANYIKQNYRKFSVKQDLMLFRLSRLILLK